jgi:hypothetical protein
MKINTLIIITVIYLILSILFNYSIFQLIIVNESNDQYFLIFIYFLSEVLAFLFFFLPKSKDKIISYTLGPIIITDESMNISNASISDNNITPNNITTSFNATDSRMSSMQPFVGMKWISFLVPSIFDFLSKFFIFNGLKMVGNEIILRSIVELVIVLIFSKIILKSQYKKFSLLGVLLILFGLIISAFYYHLSQSIKLYFNNDSYGILGMLLCVFGEIFGGIQLFFQVKYFKIGEKYSYREIAWEGLFGLIFSFLFFELSLIIPCSNENENNNDENEREIHKIFLYCYRDSLPPFKFLLSNIKNNIAWYIIFFLFSMFYNLFGVILVKYIGEVYKAAIDVSRISIILLLIMFIHTDKVSALSIVFSIVFFVIILLGIFLSIKLRQQKDIIFNQIQMDRTMDQTSLISDNNLEESYFGL